MNVDSAFFLFFHLRNFSVGLTLFALFTLIAYIFIDFRCLFIKRVHFTDVSGGPIFSLWTQLSFFPPFNILLLIWSQRNCQRTSRCFFSFIIILIIYFPSWFSLNKKISPAFFFQNLLRSFTFPLCTKLKIFKINVFVRIFYCIFDFHSKFNINNHSSVYTPVK